PGATLRTSSDADSAYISLRDVVGPIHRLRPFTPQLRGARLCSLQSSVLSKVNSRSKPLDPLARGSWRFHFPFIHPSPYSPELV
ncbi:hypothetical protein P7K49_022673, partial [Saguinus oedipus]